MHKFDLDNGRFYSYNNRTISSDQPWSLTDISESSLLRIVAWNIVQEDSKNKPQLSFRFKANRFLKHFKWADKHYKSNGGKINDTKFFVDEIIYNLKNLTKFTYLSSSEIRELLISAIRIYAEDGWDQNTPIKQEDLKRCVNLQEFHSNEVELNFEFAENLKNLRVVDSYVNDANNEYGSYKGAIYKYKSGTVIREVFNVDKLNSCLVLHLMDSHLKDYGKIPDNIWSLSLRNSNFDNLQNLSHLKNLEYLDISYTKIISASGLSNLKFLKILNLCCTKFSETNELVKIYREVLLLRELKILIIDTETLNKIKTTNDIDINLKDKIIEVPNEYFNRSHNLFRSS